MNEPSLRYVRLALILLISFSTAAVRVEAQKAEPIRLHPRNSHYFLFRGKPIVLITSGEHYGAVVNPDFDYQHYLATLEADGLNYTRLFGGSYVEVPAKSFGILRNDLAPTRGRFLAPWGRSMVPGYAGGGNKFDLDQWNPEYFKRFHDFLSEAAKRGIVVELTLFSSQYGELQWDVSPFNPANNINHIDAVDWKKLETLENGNILKYQESYTRKLVREANLFDNLIVEIQNEPWSDRPVTSALINPYLFPPARDKYPNSVDLADEPSLAWQKKVAEWISSEEADLSNRHLIAQNYSNFRYPVRSLIPGVSLVNFHYAYPEAASEHYGLGKAIGYDETGFLGREDDLYRRQAWNFMLSGGSSFDGLDYSFSVGHEDGGDLRPNGPGGGSPTLRRQLRVLSDFLQSFSLIDLHPDFNVVKHAPGATAHALSKPGWEYAIYFDGHGPAEIDFELPAGHYSAVWVNLANGDEQNPEKFEHDGGLKVLRSPPFSSGIALRIVSNKP
jgi:hypothetical protein